VEGHLTTWHRFVPLGLAPVELGLSVVGAATLRMGRGEPFVLYGTAALCVVNVGLCLFGEAVKPRALADWKAASPEGREARRGEPSLTTRTAGTRRTDGSARRPSAPPRRRGGRGPSRP
jgi:hypothetical protein